MTFIQYQKYKKAKSEQLRGQKHIMYKEKKLDTKTIQSIFKERFIQGNLLNSDVSG